MEHDNVGRYGPHNDTIYYNELIKRYGGDHDFWGDLIYGYSATNPPEGKTKKQDSIRYFTTKAKEQANERINMP